MLFAQAYTRLSYPSSGVNKLLNSRLAGKREARAGCAKRARNGTHTPQTQGIYNPFSIIESM